MQIKEVPYIKGTPARTNRRTGVIYFSKWHFNKMNLIFKKFIMYHEIAHYLFQTKDEQLCDEFATQVLLKEGVRLKKILNSLTQNLSNSKNHHGRKLNILNQLRIYDYLENNNINALKEL